jgi:hypothetical protein
MEEARSTPVQVYRDDWELIWGETPIVPVILLTIWWIVQQLFWAAVWLAGFALRVLVGLLFLFWARSSASGSSVGNADSVTYPSHLIRSGALPRRTCQS